MFNLFNKKSQKYPKYQVSPEVKKRTAKELEYVTLSEEGFRELMELDCVRKLITNTSPIGLTVVSIFEGYAKLHFPDALNRFSDGNMIHVRALIYTMGGKELIVSATTNYVEGDSLTWSSVNFVDGKEVEGIEYDLGKDFAEFLFRAERILKQGNRLTNPLGEILSLYK